MSNTFTLDALREETIRRFAPVKVELSDGSTVTLKSVLKLKEKDRTEVFNIVDEISEIPDVEDDEDDEQLAEYSEQVCSVIEKILRLITNQPRKLLAELDHDDPEIKASLYTSLLNKWIGSTQLGEAKSSPA